MPSPTVNGPGTATIPAVLFRSNAPELTTVPPEYVLALVPENTALPDPILVKLPGPLMTPLRTRESRAENAPKALSALTVIGPAQELVPLELPIAPKPDPVPPFKVSA